MKASAHDRPRFAATNLERAADHNQRVTLHAIRVGGSLTRVELASITGLTTPAINNITRRLLEAELIAEAGQRRGARGQPPTKYTIRPDACYSVGVNIDRDHITIVLVDFAGTTLARVSREIAFALPDTVADLYRSSIDAMLHEAKVSADRVIGIGLAVPDQLGSVELPGRPAGYAAWGSVDLAALFAAPLDVPVFVENDAAAAAMGEMQLGLGQRFASFFYILVSSGLGGGLVVDNVYVRGATGRSGELGFLRIDAAGEQLQTEVSLSGLARHLAGCGATLAAALGDGGDPAVAACLTDWIDRAAQRLLAPLEAINCLINPAVVLIGGRLPTPLLERLADRANRLMVERAATLPAVAPVARAALSADAPAVGAAILPFSHFLLPKPAALWKAPADAAVNANGA